MTQIFCFDIPTLFWLISEEGIALVMPKAAKYVQHCNNFLCLESIAWYTKAFTHSFVYVRLLLEGISTARSSSHVVNFFLAQKTSLRTISRTINVGNNVKFYAHDTFKSEALLCRYSSALPALLIQFMRF